MVRRLHPCRLIAVVTGLLTLYSFARVAVLFFEALSVVQSARIEDESLLQLCSEGLASGSAKMREACLKARSDRASPIFFKAIVHAVGTAFKDFSDTVGSPRLRFQSCHGRECSSASINSMAKRRRLTAFITSGLRRRTTNVAA
jgi:hypothetical protein